MALTVFGVKPTLAHSAAPPHPPNVSADCHVTCVCTCNFWACRYADVVVHRLLAAAIGIAPLPEALRDQDDLHDCSGVWWWL